MSDQNAETTEAARLEELGMLKQRADIMKVKYHPTIGLEALRNKVNATMEPDKTKEADKPKVVRTKQQQLNAVHDRKRKDAQRLVRVRITNMNPLKKEWPGEIFTVSNSVVGTVKKFVPFKGSDDGWHVPQLILNVMKERKFTQRYTAKDRKGREITKRREVKEFAIETLEPLNDKELEQLALEQARRNNLGDD